MTTTTEQAPGARTVETILDLAHVVAEPAEVGMHPTTTGISLRVQLITRADGRPVFAVKECEHETRRRASGKVFSYWRTTGQHTWILTKRGLVAHRSMQRGRFGRSTGFQTSHCFDDQELRRALNGVMATYRMRLGNLLDDRRLLVDGEAEGSIGLRVERDPLGLAQVDDRGRRDLLEAEQARLLEAALAHLGEMPSYEERYPLLARSEHNRMLARHHVAWLDAQDWSQVAKAMFGARHYRRPLAGLVEQVGTTPTALWLSLFRGLVPVEWIIDALRAEADRGAAQRARAEQAGRPHEDWGWRRPSPIIDESQAKWLRSVLRALPRPMLRRLLAEGATAVAQPLIDVIGQVECRGRRLPTSAEVAEAVALRGHARIRGARELERLLVSIAPEQPVAGNRGRALWEEADLAHQLQEYNQLAADQGEEAIEWERWKDQSFREQVALPVLVRLRQERMDREQRERAQREAERREELRVQHAEEVAWADALRERVDGQVVDGLVVQVATDPQELVRWSMVMKNCIDTYGHKVDREVLGALVEPGTGRMVANFEATRAEGVRQLLGRFDASMAKAIGAQEARSLVEAMGAIGLEASPSTIGLKGLWTAQPA